MTNAPQNINNYKEKIITYEKSEEWQMCFEPALFQAVTQGFLFFILVSLPSWNPCQSDTAKGKEAKNTMGDLKGQVCK